MASEKTQGRDDPSHRVDEASEENRARELRARATSIVQIDDGELPQSIKDVLQGRMDQEK
jgi:hypothetical protein